MKFVLQLDSFILNSALNIEDYNLIRLGRSMKEGGVVYHKDNGRKSLRGVEHEQARLFTQDFKKILK